MRIRNEKSEIHRSRLSSVYNKIFATVSGMTLLYADKWTDKGEGNAIPDEYISKCKVILLTKTKSSNNGSFSVTCLTYLKRNDIL